MLGFTDGEATFARNVARNVGRICRRHGAMYTTGFVTRNWERGRFRDPYMREDLEDYGIMTDTLECAVNWETSRVSMRAYVLIVTADRRPSVPRI